MRPISSESSLLPMAHGSALFTRGETQALATATLGSKVRCREGLHVIVILHYDVCMCNGDSPWRRASKRWTSWGPSASTCSIASLPRPSEKWGESAGSTAERWPYCSCMYVCKIRIYFCSYSGNVCMYEAMYICIYVDVHIKYVCMCMYVFKINIYVWYCVCIYVCMCVW